MANLTYCIHKGVGPTSVHERKDDEFVASADQDEEFDMFAQSRKSTFDESRKG